MNLTFRRASTPKEIRSDAERERAAAQVAFFRAALEKAGGKKPARRNAEFVAKCESMLRERESQIRDYDDLRNGKLNLPKFQRIGDIAAFIPRIRIARGISQTDLAQRLGVSKQVVNRYEESGYQTVGLARLQEILDALHTKIEIGLATDTSA
jgi:ribosome-binding protein aMBF1 (putative translation factor)